MGQPPSDVVIPVVFPNYLVKVETAPIDVNLPIHIPGVPAHFKIPPLNERVPYLGHAGAAFFNGHTGVTKYFEYGRYDPKALGLVRQIAVPDLRMPPTISGLLPLLKSISARSGQHGPILGAYIQLPAGAYSKMLAYCNRRMSENSNPKRTPYSLLGHSCCHFMCNVAEAGGASMPPVLPPEPAGYIRVVRMLFPTLDYAPPSTLAIPCLGSAAAATAAGTK